MGLFNHTHLAISAEGIVTPDDLVEFTKDGPESMSHNLHKPPGMLVIPIVNDMLVANHAGILTEVQPYVVSAKLKMRLFVALKIAKYYELTLHPLTPLNMSWIVLENFEQ